MSQLALPLRLDDHAVFDTYHGDANEIAVAALQAIADGADDGAGGAGDGGWLWGGEGTGKSHLLQAVCERAGAAAMFVPLAELAAAGPGVLDGLERRSLIAIDDLDRIAGASDWEQAMFGLYNRLRDRGGRLVVAGRRPPRDSGIILPDLQSRLTQLPVYQLQPLDDDGRLRALQLRARRRGLELPEDTARFLLNRSRRDMGSLYALLDRLDEAALRAQRRLTIPFVREALTD